MPNVPVQLDLPSGEKPDKFWQMLQRIYKQVAKTINGNIGFGSGLNVPQDATAHAGFQDNINGVWISVKTPAAPNTDFTVTHNLGRAVTGYWIMAKDAAIDLYNSPSANPNPTTQFIFRATVGSINIFIFIL